MEDDRLLKSHRGKMIGPLVWETVEVEGKRYNVQVRINREAIERMILEGIRGMDANSHNVVTYRDLTGESTQLQLTRTT